MDVLLMSRLQFAFATFVHFLFVPLTLGLSVLVAVMETKYAKTGDEIYLKMAKYWGKIFLINFAAGVVTGITLEFQFGTNWSRYSAYVGDIFGSLLAIEALGFFFLESTMLGVWIFGWKKLSAKAHAIVMWLVAFSSTGSAIWILTANSFMQNPVGYEIRNGRAELVDFFAVLFQPFAWLAIAHTLSAAFILSSFFVMGVSAYNILKKKNTEFFTKSFRIALVMGVIFSFFIIAEGHMHGAELTATQPAKMAAMESHWETASSAPWYLFSWPDVEKEENIIELVKLPKMLSFMATHSFDGTVIGLKDIPKDERPPVKIPYLAFRGMVGLAGLFALLMLIGLWKRNDLENTSWYLKLMVYSIPLPYIACQLGWALAEVGRQPWIVYGLMKTQDAYSPITAVQNGVSLFAFFAVYTVLTITAFYLISKAVKKTPAAA